MCKNLKLKLTKFKDETVSTSNIYFSTSYLPSYITDSRIIITSLPIVCSDLKLSNVETKPLHLPMGFLFPLVKKITQTCSTRFLLSRSLSLFLFLSLSFFGLLNLHQNLRKFWKFLLISLVIELWPSTFTFQNQFNHKQWFDSRFWPLILESTAMYTVRRNVILTLAQVTFHPCSWTLTRANIIQVYNKQSFNNNGKQPVNKARF